jgi:hypothetical protein
MKSYNTASQYEKDLSTDQQAHDVIRVTVSRTTKQQGQFTEPYTEKARKEKFLTCHGENEKKNINSNR